MGLRARMRFLCVRSFQVDLQTRSDGMASICTVESDFSPLRTGIYSSELTLSIPRNVLERPRVLLRIILRLVAHLFEAVVVSSLRISTSLQLSLFKDLVWNRFEFYAAELENE